MPNPMGMEERGVLFGTTKQHTTINEHFVQKFRICPRAPNVSKVYSDL